MGRRSRGAAVLASLGIALGACAGLAAEAPQETASGETLAVATPITAADRPTDPAQPDPAEPDPADLDTPEDAVGTPEPVDAPLDPLSASPSLSTSIGGPSDGRLEGGFPLPAEGPGFRSNLRRPNPDAFFGTVETIRALVRAAAVVHEEMPGSELVINDIGFREGGPITHHGSHRAGRDVDVLFYYFDREGSPWPAKGVPVDPRGRGWDFGDLADPGDDVRVRLDVPRTWRLVQALLEGEDPSSPLQRIFLAEHVRTLLLDHAERVRAPQAVRDRFGDLTCQPGYPHDDHFHFRFFCTPEDVRAGCMDGGPMYPWRRQQLQADGVDAVMAPRAPRARTTRGRERPTAAAAEPIRMHARVRTFLDQRATWSATPHPGRRYCR